MESEIKDEVLFKLPNYSNFLYTIIKAFCIASIYPIAISIGLCINSGSNFWNDFLTFLFKCLGWLLIFIFLYVLNRNKILVKEIQLSSGNLNITLRKYFSIRIIELDISKVEINVRKDLYTIGNYQVLVVSYNRSEIIKQFETKNWNKKIMLSVCEKINNRVFNRSSGVDTLIAKNTDSPE